MRLNTEISNAFVDLMNAHETRILPMELGEEWLNILAPALDEAQERQQVFIALNNSDEEQELQSEIIAGLTNDADIEDAEDYMVDGLIKKTDQIFNNDNYDVIWCHRITYGLDRIIHGRQGRRNFSERTGLRSEQINSVCDVMADFVKQKRLLLAEDVKKPEQPIFFETGISGILHSGSYQLKL